MDLHQIQVIYREEEDRILFRASLKATEGTLQEIRAWLTRRLVKRLWPAIVNALETQVALDRPYAAHASADIVGMDHQASVDEIRGDGGFDNPYTAEKPDYPLGEKPILLALADFTQTPNRPIRINLMQVNGRGFEVAFTLTTLHGFCSLLKKAVQQADWDMALTMPGEILLAPSTAMLN